MLLTEAEIAAGMALWLKRWPLVDPAAITWAAPLVQAEQLRSPYRALARDPRWPAAIRPPALHDPDEIATGFALFAFMLASNDADRRVFAEEGWLASPMVFDGCCTAAQALPGDAMPISDIPAFPLAECDRLHCMCGLVADPR